jgi:Uma2 family endonuclease
MTTVAQIEQISPVTRKRFRVEDFHKMMKAGIIPEESGWEVIDGYLIDKMTIGSKHASVIRRLSKLLERKVGEIALISGQNPVHIDDYNEPEPDIALLKPRADFYATSHPTPEDVLIAIEISDSTLVYDREIKKTLYAAGIAEYWLVNLQNGTVGFYAQPKDGNYRLTIISEAGEMLESHAVENLTLAIDEILGL